MLITLDNFCTLLRSKSPCFTIAWYCQFLLSGRLVSTTPPTRSTLQCNLPAAINRDNSLQIQRMQILKCMSIECIN